MAETQRTETLHVLVHPHWLLGNADHPERTPFGREKEKLFELQLRKVPMNASSHIRLLEVMHRYYKREIMRIAKAKGAKLAILRSHDHLPFVNRDISGDPNLQVGSFQRRLAEFAERKLGKRFVGNSFNSHDLAQELKANRVALNVPITMFGEYADLCVAEASKNLCKHGFTNITIDSSKSIRSSLLRQQEKLAV